MAPIVHCVRHAQGVHNLSPENHVMPDPPLTDLGVAQCRTLRDTFPHDKIDLVTASPLRRTIYTALESFEPVFRARPDTRLILIPDAQETSDVPCDTGSSPADLQREMEEKGLPVDVGLVEEGWNVKAGRYAPTNDAVQARARAARRWLKARPEKEIVIVTHGTFLHYLTEDWEDCSKGYGTAWVNTEYRTYNFSANEDTEDLESRPIDGDNATLVETSESRRRRGKENPMPGREEQKKLFLEGKQRWDEQGLQLSTAEREAAAKAKAEQQV